MDSRKRTIKLPRRAKTALIIVLLLIILALGLEMPTLLIRKQADSYAEHEFNEDMDTAKITQSTEMDYEHENRILRIASVVSVWDFYNSKITEFDKNNIPGDEYYERYDSNILNKEIGYCIPAPYEPAEQLYELEQYSCTPKVSDLPDTYKDNAGQVALDRARTTSGSVTIITWRDPEIDVLVNITVTMSLRTFTDDFVMQNINHVLSIYPFLDSIKDLDKIATMLINFMNDNNVKPDHSIGADPYVRYGVPFTKLESSKDGVETITYYTHAEMHGLYVFYRYIRNTETNIITLQTGFAAEPPK